MGVYTLDLSLKWHPLDAIVDRPRKEAAAAFLAAWIAFVAGLLAAGNEVTDLPSLVIGCGIGVALVLLGFAAASRCRVLEPRTGAQRVRWFFLSLVCGVGLGIANLGANWTMAAAHPTLDALLTDRVTTLPPLRALFAAPVVEEIALRLFLMSVIAWVVSRFTARQGLVFALALGVSSLIFALLHLDRQFPADPALANLYATALVVKYTLLGLPQGWIFWRWGLPYAIFCHFAINATHLLLQPIFF